MGLFALGYNGALNLPTERLFMKTESSIYMGLQAIYGPKVPFIIKQLRVTCPALKARSELSRTDIDDKNYCNKWSKNTG